MRVSKKNHTSKSADDTPLINSACKLQTIRLGTENNTVVIVDDFLSNADNFLKQEHLSSKFVEEADNYYPGTRSDISANYSSSLKAFFLDNIAGIFGAFDTGSWSIQSKLCLANKAPKDLSPIQSIPHFDTSDVNQIAAVHYLCDAPFQGTSFYQHRTSGFESISPERSKAYFKWLSREAITTGMPKSGYIMGDSELFKRVGKVDCKYNRIIFYKSNMLHAGDIDAKTDLNKDPLRGRLTANSFIKFSIDTF
jgi:hypothetical protein